MNAKVDLDYVPCLNHEHCLSMETAVESPEGLFPVRTYEFQGMRGDFNSMKAVYILHVGWLYVHGHIRQIFQFQNVISIPSVARALKSLLITFLWASNNRMTSKCHMYVLSPGDISVELSLFTLWLRIKFISVGMWCLYCSITSI